MLGPAYIIINCQLETFPHYIQCKTPAVGTNNDIMGIQGQNYMLWVSSDISFDNLVILLEHRLNERRRSHLTERVRPKVVVDASLLGYKVLAPTMSMHLIMCGASALLLLNGILTY